MASNIGKLVVSLTANTSSFSKGMRKASFRLRRFSRDAKRLSVTMLATSAAILAPLALSVKRFADYGDQVAKMARRTGLSTEAVSELGYAAEISGANIDSLEKGVKRMARTITDAESGLLTYVRAFDKLGLEAETLSKMTPEDAFMRIGRAIADMESPILRAASAQEIFGRAGTMLLPLFAEGAEGMAKWRARARELGVSLSTLATEQAERLTDALTDVKFALTGTAIAIAEQIAPEVEKFVLVVSDSVAGVSDWIRINKDFIRSSATVAAVVASVTGVVGGLAAATWAVTAALSVLALHPLVVAFTAAVGAGWLLADVLDALLVRLRLLAPKQERLAKKAAEAKAAIEALGGQVNETTTAISEIAGASGDLADELDDVANNAIEAAGALERLQSGRLRDVAIPLLEEPHVAVRKARRELELIAEQMQLLYAGQQPGVSEGALAARGGLIRQLADDYEAVARRLENAMRWQRRLSGDALGLGDDAAERGGGPSRRPGGGRAPAALERGTVGAYSAVVGQYYRQAERHAERTARNTERANEIATQIRDKIEAPPDLQNAPL